MEHLPSPARHSVRAYFCLGLSMTLVGSYVALTKPLVLTLGVFALAWMRFLVGVLAVPHWLRKPPHEPALSARLQALLFLESFLGNFLFSICMLYGISQTSAMAAGVILSMLPIAVALLSVLFLREKPSPWLAWAMLCATAGMVLLNTGAAVSGSATETLWGNALVLAAVFCEAAYAVIGKRLTHALSPRRITALINLWGCVLMTPLALWHWPDMARAQITLSTWGLVLFYGLAASVWSVWLWMTGLRHVSASQAGVFTVMLPIAASLMGWVMGETPTARQGLAMLLAMGGVLMATRHAPSQASGPLPGTHLGTQREKNNISE
jgi:drug/metabolite transporter (DMT)-like permease